MLKVEISLLKSMKILHRYDLWGFLVHLCQVLQVFFPLIKKPSKRMSLKGLCATK